MDLCIPHLLAAQADRSSHAVAIATPGRAPLTYRRLHQRMREVVNTPHASGIGRHERVALALPNGPEMAVAFPAVAAGAIGAPLNPACRAHEFDSYPTDESARL
jgi:acyl-CoA synthetase (AMP-forming)/AMP-acid ligase II